MKILGRLSVFPRLPERVRRLEDLAYNLWWAWNPQVQALFADMDPDLWEACNHNPVRFLREVPQEWLEAAARDPGYLARYDTALAAFDAYMSADDTWFTRTYGQDKEHLVAYFSAEFGLHEALPMYSGGLGVLSGDHCKEASDLGIPLVGVGFLYPQGYFTQRITADGEQEALYERINFAEMPARAARKPDGSEVKVYVDLPGRRVYARVWHVQVGRVPLYLLDTDVPENVPDDRALAARLYGGDHEMRISQEIILGIGGVRALHALGLHPTVYHLNEGHSAFLGLERIRLLMVEEGLSFSEALEVVRATSLFTTHTPVAAGHDTFPFPMMDKYFSFYWGELGLTRDEFLALGYQDYSWGPQFSMTVLAIRQAALVNGVSRLHGEVSRRMWKHLWPGLLEEEVPIGYITNGVHLPSWLSPALVSLLDRYLPADWRERADDEEVWAAASDIPDEVLWETHLRLKEDLVDLVRRRVREQLIRHGASPTRIRRVESLFDPAALTIGFARRFATYKRATLIFRDIERIKRILNAEGRPVQIIFAGKAHPADEPGKALIRQVHQLSREPGFEGRILFLENYDMHIARSMVQGVDVWLNNPRRPMEASGTSGQKAGANGVPNLSVLDGWWPEGYNGHNGWAVGRDESYPDPEAQDEADALSLYNLLEEEVVPLYYGTEGGVPRQWLAYMRASMTTIAPRFSTRRMVKEYATRYYVPAMHNHLAMSRDNFQVAKMLASWRSHVQRAWPNVTLVAWGPGDARLRVGDEVTIEARLHPAGLSPDDVVVEAVYGATNGEDELRDPVVHPMTRVNGGEDGGIRYQCTFRVERNGEIAYGVRVVPYRPELPQKFDLGLVTWADARPLSL